MKDIPSNAEDNNIYCTAADSSVHSFLPTAEHALLRTIKLCSLLCEHVYISCAHIYENRHTHDLLVNNPELLTRGLVAVGLRSDCRDFHDLLDLRSAEGRPATPGDVAVTEFLDRHAPGVIRWAPMDMQPLFKSSIIAMLEDPDSLLRRRLTATPRTAVAELARRIADLRDEDSNRTMMHRLAMQHLPLRTKAFMREVNLLYYVLGSADKNLRPHLSPPLFTDLDRGCAASMEPRQESPFDRWLEGMLRQTSFPIQLVDRLTVSQVAHIRENARDVFARFRNKWWRVASGDNARELFRSTQEDVVQRLADEVKKETGRIAAYERTSRWVAVSSLLLSAASLAPHPAIAALSFLVTAGAYAASFDSVKHRALKADFAALTTTIVDHATE